MSAEKASAQTPVLTRAMEAYLRSIGFLLRDCAFCCGWLEGS